MARIYYYVVNSGTLWEIKFDGQKPGTQFLYATQRGAIDAARVAASANWTKHRWPSGVRIQGVLGQWRDEMTYGNGPYPPRG